MMKARLLIKQLTRKDESDDVWGKRRKPKEGREIDRRNKPRERERDKIDPKLVERVVMSRKAGSLMRCERMDPKKGKDLASKRDGRSHRRRENHEWLMQEWWHAEARKRERRKGLC